MSIEWPKAYFSLISLVDKVLFFIEITSFSDIERSATSHAPRGVILLEVTIVGVDSQMGDGKAQRDESDELFRGFVLCRGRKPALFFVVLFVARGEKKTFIIIRDWIKITINDRLKFYFALFESYRRSSVVEWFPQWKKTYWRINSIPFLFRYKTPKILSTTISHFSMFFSLQGTIEYENFK